MHNALALPFFTLSVFLMWLTAVWIFVGLLLLFAGGDVLVRGASDLARRLGVSPLLVGLTVVGFGTSTPELVTSIQAATQGYPGIAVGNVVGSNICNILLILGVAAVLCPINVERRSFERDGTFLVVATVLCLGIISFGQLGRGLGGLLAMGLVGYLCYAFFSERRADSPGIASAQPASQPSPGSGSLWLSIVLAVGGIAMTIVGARLLVDAAVELATAAGIPESVIGLTIVAVGTSLPELVTAVVAALKRQTDVAFGNIVGSNIYNILGILGLTAMVEPIAVPQEIAAVDIWVMCAATLALIAMVVSGWRIRRGEGAVLLVAYAAYLGYLATTIL